MLPGQVRLPRFPAALCGLDVVDVQQLLGSLQFALRSLLFRSGRVPFLPRQPLRLPRPAASQTALPYRCAITPRASQSGARGRQASRPRRGGGGTHFRARSRSPAGRARVGLPQRVTPKILAQRAGRDVSSPGLLLQALQADGLQVARHARAQGEGGTGLAGLNSSKVSSGVSPRKGAGRRAARRGWRPGRTRPRAACLVSLAPGLLGRHVAGRAQDHSRPGLLGRLGVAQRPSSSRASRSRSPGAPSSLHRRQGRPLPGAELQQDVAGLEVTNGPRRARGRAAPPGPASGRAGRPGRRAEAHAAA